jgi:ssDNA-binding Zn-finger/Zn-ribbon topoisomerase 1
LQALQKGGKASPKLQQSNSDFGLGESEKRTYKIQFEHRVQVESLMVPTCPTHGQKFMEFQKGASGKAPVVEFSDIVDWVKESRALGARCTCTKCIPPKNLGNIEKTKGAIIEKAEDNSLTGGGLHDWSCFGCEMALMTT